MSYSATLYPKEPSPYTIQTWAAHEGAGHPWINTTNLADDHTARWNQYFTSDSGRHSFAPRANPPPTPRVPKAPVGKRKSDMKTLSLRERARTQAHCPRFQWKKNKRFYLGLAIAWVLVVSWCRQHFRQSHRHQRRWCCPLPSTRPHSAALSKDSSGVQSSR